MIATLQGAQTGIKTGPVIVQDHIYVYAGTCHSPLRSIWKAIVTTSVNSTPNNSNGNIHGVPPLYNEHHP